MTLDSGGNSTCIVSTSARVCKTLTIAFTVVGNTPTIIMTMTSDHGTNVFNFTLRPEATQNVGFVTATRVNSSGGQRIFDYRGTLTTATNWTTVIPSITPAPIYQMGY